MVAFAACGNRKAAPAEQDAVPVALARLKSLIKAMPDPGKVGACASPPAAADMFATWRDLREADGGPIPADVEQRDLILSAFCNPAPTAGTHPVTYLLHPMQGVDRAASAKQLLHGALVVLKPDSVTLPTLGSGSTFEPGKFVGRLIRFSDQGVAECELPVHAENTQEITVWASDDKTTRDYKVLVNLQDQIRHVLDATMK